MTERTPIPLAVVSHFRSASDGDLVLGLAKWCFAFLLSAGLTIGPNSAAASPLPVDMALGVKRLDLMEPRSFSSDGRWVSFTYQVTGKDTASSDSARFSITGVPAEGYWVRHIQLIYLTTGETIELTQGDNHSWGASWSPDGQSLAYYSDEGGEAGIWVWDATSRVRRRVGHAIARPFWSYERPRWSADGRHLLVKILPEGVTVAAANKLLPDAGAQTRPYVASTGGSPAVAVLNANQISSTDHASLIQGIIDVSLADLALIDVESGRTDRIVVGRRISNYRVSPDEENVAYVVPKGSIRNKQLSVFDLRVTSVDGSEDRVLQDGVLGGAVDEFVWSPDGNRIAYFSDDGRGFRRLSVRGLDGSKMDFAENLGTISQGGAPLFDSDGHTLYFLKNGALWSLELTSRKLSKLTESSRINLRQIVGKLDSGVIWRDRGKIWAYATDVLTAEDLIVSIDPSSRSVLVALRGGEQIIHGIAGDVTSAGVLAYAGGDAHRPFDVWLYDIRNNSKKRLSQLNRPLEHFALGDTRRISWVSERGQKLEGALLLPPHYKEGEKLPTIVWVYAGARVKPLLKEFGLGMSEVPVFNFHILTTRGYAVFYPDIPVREGEILNDVYAAVMPGVDALIAQGFTDSSRLGLMGQSFGSYTAWALLVQTDRFKAAITTANQDPNLFSAYLRMNVGDGSAWWTGYFEGGQGGMGGDPWTYKCRYLKNSPVFNLDRINTPLLMAQGSEDGDLRGPDSLYIALARLKKNVEYRVYKNEGHVISSPENVTDLWIRRLEFLDQYIGDHTAL